MKKHILLSLIAIIISNCSFSQDLIVIPDPIFQISKNQIFNLTIINNSQQSGLIRLDCKVFSRSGVMILNEQMSTMIEKNESIRIRDKSSRIQTFIDPRFQNYYIDGILPPMDYQICYQAYFVSDAALKANECVDIIASDFISIIPLFPSSEDTIGLRNPFFSWNNLLTTELNISYNFKLVEVKDNQNPMIALRREVPLVSLKHLSNSYIDYPVDAQPLKDKSNYAWQVEINLDGETFAKSDAFGFIYVESKKYNKISRDISYIDILNLSENVQLYAIGILKLKYEAEDNDEFEVELFSINDSKRKKINVEKKSLDVIKGLNKFKYDLENQVYLKHNKKYLIQLKCKSTGNTYLLNFIYLNPNYIK